MIVEMTIMDIGLACLYPVPNTKLAREVFTITALVSSQKWSAVVCAQGSD